MDFSEDNLTAVLSRIARRGSAVYPEGSWDQIATFTALRRPDQFNVEAFRKFQEKLLEIIGIEATVAGGAYGCIRLIVKLRKADHRSNQDESLELTADFPEGRADDAARLLAVMLANSKELRALATESGIDRVQTREAAINMKTGETTSIGSGMAPPPYLQFNSMTVKGSVGQVGDANKSIGTRVGKDDEDDGDRPGR